MPTDVVIPGFFTVVAVTAVILSAVLYRIQDTRGRWSLIATTLGVALWSGAMVGQTLSGEVGYRLFHSLMHAGILITVNGFFVFGMEYTGRERYVTERTIGVLVGIASVAFAAILLNPGNLVHGDLTQVDTVLGYQYEWAPLFALYLGYAYSLVIGGAYLVLALIFRTRQTMYTGQAISLLLGILPPVFMNVLFLGGVIEVDLTSAGFLVTLVLFTFAIARYRLGNVAPIARRKVIDNVRDGVLVVDTSGRFVDVNAAGLWMMGLSNSPVGRQVDEILADVPELLETYREMTAEPSVSEETVSYGDRFFEVEATPIEDDRNRHVGWTILLHDVTERVRRERDLEEQIERLDQFASIVSHDLRNPINVASGYIEHAQATGEMEHLEKSLDAIDRMDSIIEDVLVLTREGGGVTEPTTVSLEGIAREAWKTVETSGATLEVEDALVVADADQFRRLFENLFKNAIEHGVEGETSAGSRSDGSDQEADDSGQVAADLLVTVGIREEEGSGRTVFVADNGVGIPPEEREQVFEKGYSTGGTGLGLDIVTQIARAHDWEMGVSESDSGGACFEISGVSEPVANEY